MSAASGSASSRGAVPTRASAAGKSPRRRTGCSPSPRPSSSSKGDTPDAPEEHGAPAPAECDQSPAGPSKTKMVVLAGVNLLKKITHLNHHHHHNHNNNHCDTSAGSAAASSASSGPSTASGAATSSSKSSQKKRAKERDKRIDIELNRLNSKIECLLGKLDEVKPEAAQCPEEECIICSQNRATMQTFPCAHQVVCRTCFVKMIQMTVAQKKLPLRCVLCRAKILRLQQNHGSRLSRDQRASVAAAAANSAASGHTMGPGGRSLSISSSNYSFASGVSSVSSASSTSSSRASVKSFNFDSISNFQNVNLISKAQLQRTTTGNCSFRRRSHSPSPSSASSSSNSTANRYSLGPRINVGRTPSDESLSSRMSVGTATSSPGSSSASPRSPVSPSWSAPRSPNTLLNEAPSSCANAPSPAVAAAAAAAFFPSPNVTPATASPANPLYQAPQHRVDSSAASASGNSAAQGQSAHITRGDAASGRGPVVVSSNPKRPATRFGTPLSPIKESRQESSSSGVRADSLEEEDEDEVALTVSMPPLAQSEEDDDEEEDAHGVVEGDDKLRLLQNGYVEHGAAQICPPKPSSRIRCADKILTQLEIHAEAELYFGGGNERHRGNRAILTTWSQQMRSRTPSQQSRHVSSSATAPRGALLYNCTTNSSSDDVQNANSTTPLDNRQLRGGGSSALNGGTPNLSRRKAKAKSVTFNEEVEVESFVNHQDE